MLLDEFMVIGEVSAWLGHNVLTTKSLVAVTALICRAYLESIAKHLEIWLIWVLRYWDISENCRADEIARLCTTLLFLAEFEGVGVLVATFKMNCWFFSVRATGLRWANGVICVVTRIWRAQGSLGNSYRFLGRNLDNGVGDNWLLSYWQPRADVDGVIARLM